MEILNHANIFETDSIAWVDIGLYRDAVKEGTSDYSTAEIAKYGSRQGRYYNCMRYMLVLISSE